MTCKADLILRAIEQLHVTKAVSVIYEGICEGSGAPEPRAEMERAIGSARESLQGGIHIYLSDSMPGGLRELMRSLRPWRKGPFYLHFSDGDLFLDTEWRSFIKMRYLMEAFERAGVNLDSKKLLDVGCNNGYYMFALGLMDERIASITGCDPVSHFHLQYTSMHRLIAQVMNVELGFELCGLQDLADHKYDIVLCMGVLYHRSEPFSALRKLRKILGPGGVLILETLIIMEQREVSLVPHPTYARMRNVFFIFSPKALQNLALKAGFRECELISYSFTDRTQQRTTDFIEGSSLGDGLGACTTAEGYPAACRGFFLLR